MDNASVTRADDLITHLITAHGIKPWSIAGSRQAQEEHHAKIHTFPRRPLDHTHLDLAACQDCRDGTDLLPSEMCGSCGRHFEMEDS